MATHAYRSAIPEDLKRGLRNYWYPVLPSSAAPSDRPIGITRLGEELVVWRDGAGSAHVFVDRCSHRAARLSIGDIVNGRLQCRYHGLQYDGTGQCRLVPVEQREDGRQAQRLCVPAYPTREQDGAVWAYLGDVEVFPPGPLPAHDDHPELGDPSFVWLITEMVWNANWLLIHDNTSDLFHFPFLHGHYGVTVTPNGMRMDPLPPRNPIISDMMAEALAFDDYESVVTGNGVRTRRKSAADEPTIDDVEFTMPCAAKVWVPTPVGGHPFRSIQYEMALDETQTYCLFFLGRKADSDEERELTYQLLDQVFRMGTTQVFGEDSWMTESQGDVEGCLAAETLLATDAGPLRVRKMIHDAHRSQQERLAEHVASVGRDAPPFSPRIAKRPVESLAGSQRRSSPIPRLDVATGLVSLDHT
jgi:nitrite reductase/ring-hydroxylating ferredoxin subunit